MKRIYYIIRGWSLKCALKKHMPLIYRLRAIVPDISEQEFSEHTVGHKELKRRGLQAFQVELMLKEVKQGDVVVDIGDSAGTHMTYLKSFIGCDTISVNLDKRAVDKIKAKGMRAILCRAEDLDIDADLYTSFQMLEHLHDPCKFLHQLKGNRLLITVPYLQHSRVGLHNIRHGIQKDITAEEEHIFELSPEDWELLFLHSGWKVVSEETYYQYPKFLGWLWRIFWRATDYEGFWGAVLERDTTYSDKYKDW